MKSLKLNHFSIFTLSICAVLLLIIASCSNSDQDKNEEELIKIGNKQSEEINIINFDSQLKVTDCSEDPALSLVTRQLKDPL